MKRTMRPTTPPATRRTRVRVGTSGGRRVRETVGVMLPDGVHVCVCDTVAVTVGDMEVEGVTEMLGVSDGVTLGVGDTLGGTHV